MGNGYDSVERVKRDWSRDSSMWLNPHSGWAANDTINECSSDIGLQVRQNMEEVESGGCRTRLPFGGPLLQLGFFKSIDLMCRSNPRVSEFLCQASTNTTL
jgi:hypothetical protein